MASYEYITDAIQNQMIANGFNDFELNFFQ